MPTSRFSIDLLLACENTTSHKYIDSRLAYQAMINHDKAQGVEVIITSPRSAKPKGSVCSLVK